jgi:hypothetical protein
MDGGDRSRREHAIESNATTRVVYRQSNCRVRTFFGSKGTHSVPYEAAHKRLPIPFRLGWLKQIFYAKRGALDCLSRTQVTYGTCVLPVSLPIHAQKGWTP